MKSAWKDICNCWIFQWFQSCQSAFFQSIELQIVRQLIAGGAGGRGEALGSAPTPQGVKGVLGPQMQFLSSWGSWGSGGVRPCRRPLPKSSPKVHKKSSQKKVQNFDPKWPPKGTLKISKISPNLQNGTLKHLSRALLAAFIAGRVPSRPQGPPEPQKS